MIRQRIGFLLLVVFVGIACIWAIYRFIAAENVTAIMLLTLTLIITTSIILFVPLGKASSATPVQQGHPEIAESTLIEDGLTNDFLSRVSLFSKAHWHSVISDREFQGRTYWESWKILKRTQRALNHLDEHCKDNAECVEILKNIDRTVRQLSIDFRSTKREEAQRITVTTAMFLYYREILGPRELKAVYHPFERVVPFDSLLHHWG